MHFNEFLASLAGAHCRIGTGPTHRNVSKHRRSRNPATPNRWLPTPEAIALGQAIDLAYERSGLNASQFAAAGGLGYTKSYRVRQGHFRYVNAALREACHFWGVEVPAHMRGPGDYDCYNSAVTQ